MESGGVWQGRQLLPVGWVEEATRTVDPKLAAGTFDGVIPWGYQYLWWTAPGEDHAFAAIGFRGQFIYANPGQHVVIVLTNVWKNGADPGLHRETRDLIKAFVTALHS